MENKEFLIRGFSVFAFLFFGLSLAIPSGYSYGSVGMLLCGLIGVTALWKHSWRGETKLLVCIFWLMGLLWGISFDSLWSWTGSDLLWKYWLAALTLAAAAWWGIRPVAVESGICAGAVGALGIAAYQYLVLGWDKAWGYTNAIQFGGLAMYLGIAAWVVALFTVQRWYWLGLIGVAGACGVLASLLSETRGAWVVVPLMLASLLLMLWQQGRKRQSVVAVGAAICLLFAVALPFAQKLESRVTRAVMELQQYQHNPQHAAVTSVGQRLEQWRFAWTLIQEKPVFGWGVQGFIDKKRSLVEQGRFHPSVLDYGHVHNEVLDMAAKRGVIGLSLLLLFYGLPLYVFWPTSSRLKSVTDQQRHHALAIRAAASLLPIAYFGFGWTQVFFAHNSGNMFYLFAVAAFWGSLQYLEKRYNVEDT